MAILEARSIGKYGAYEGQIAKEGAQRLEDLMEAVHNLPWALTHWDECDVDRIRDDLKRYDAAWEGTSAVGPLLDAFERQLEQVED